LGIPCPVPTPAGRIEPRRPLSGGVFCLAKRALPQVFLNSVSYTTDQLMWLTIIHLAFVASAFMLAHIDRLMGLGKAKKGEA
jgi:hypothetical protein